MLQNAAQLITKKMICNGTIEPALERTYAYGFELLLSSIIGVLSIAFISLLTNRAFLWIPFMIGFVPIRLSGGGYHANTHIGCVLSFSAIFTALLLLSNYSSELPYFPITAAGGCLYVMIIFSPVETQNKPLKADKWKKNRTISIVIGIVNSLLSVILTVFSCCNNNATFMYFAGIAASGLSAFMAVIINKMKRRCTDETEG